MQIAALPSSAFMRQGITAFDRKEISNGGGVLQPADIGRCLGGACLSLAHLDMGLNGEALQEGSAGALAGLSQGEVATLVGLLQRVNANLDKLVAEEPD